MSDYQHIRVEPISTALGAVIHGIDCRSDLPNSVVDEIRKAWLEHLVVFFQGQDLEPGEQLAFARRFGLPVKYPMLEGLSEFPEVVRVVKLSHEKNNFGGIWHSDTTYLEQPPIGALLLAREVPEVGGDTLFANMYLAYEALSSGLKNILDGLSLAVFGDIERSALDLKSSLGTDAHCTHDGGVHVGNRDRAFNRQQRPLICRLTVQKTSFRSTAEHHHAGATGEMPVQAVVFHVTEFIDLVSCLIIG